MPAAGLFAGAVLAQVLTAPDAFSAATGILVTLGSSALWLFTGTALVVAIALGRGYRPEIPLLSHLREALKEVWPSVRGTGRSWRR